MAIGNPNPAPLKASQRWIKTPKARLNYANLFKARVSRFDTSKSNFSCVLVFGPEVAQELLGGLKQLVYDVAVEAFGVNAANSPDTVYPFKKLTPDHPKMPGFPVGSEAVNLQSQFQPQLCDQHAQPVLSPDVIYSGCY